MLVPIGRRTQFHDATNTRRHLFMLRLLNTAQENVTIRDVLAASCLHPLVVPPRCDNRSRWRPPHATGTVLYSWRCSQIGAPKRAVCDTCYKAVADEKKRQTSLCTFRDMSQALHLQHTLKNRQAPVLLISCCVGLFCCFLSCAVVSKAVSRSP